MEYKKNCQNLANFALLTQHDKKRTYSCKSERDGKESSSNNALTKSISWAILWGELSKIAYSLSAAHNEENYEVGRDEAETKK